VQKTKIGIVGLGGIGGLIAALLKNKNYTVVSNKKSKKKNLNLDLNSNFYGKFKHKIKIDPHLRSVNIIFICIKYPYLNKSLKLISNKNALVVPFLNGLSHFKILNKKFGKKSFISNIGKVVSMKRGKLSIFHSSKNSPEVLISSHNKRKSDLKIIKRVLDSINFKTKIINKDNIVIWNKLVRLSAISSITSLYNCNLGEIRRSKKKMRELKNLVKEGLRISKKSHNFSGNFSNIIKLIRTFPNSLTTSLQRDINLKYSSELETQIGSIVKLSNQYSVCAPVYKKIYDKIKKK
tara:strand:+ start:1256 stop:2134 length:879 start_codon:yes stop_codon:yes gene_type:complete